MMAMPSSSQVIIGHKTDIGLYQFVLLTDKGNYLSWFRNNLNGIIPRKSRLYKDGGFICASAVSVNPELNPNEPIGSRSTQISYEDMLKSMERRPGRDGDWLAGYLYLEDRGIWIKNEELHTHYHKSDWKELLP